MTILRRKYIVHGLSKDQFAYRVEMGRILGSIITVKILCRKFGVGVVVLR